jgi:hypothetical protein
LAFQCLANAARIIEPGQPFPQERGDAAGNWAVELC